VRVCTSERGARRKELHREQRAEIHVVELGREGRTENREQGQEIREKRKETRDKRKETRNKKQETRDAPGSLASTSDTSLSSAARGSAVLITISFQSSSPSSTCV
jgi:hypothetical protein